MQNGYHFADGIFRSIYPHKMIFSLDSNLTEICYNMSNQNITVTSQQAPQITCLTIVYLMFSHAQIKENIKTPRHWLCAGISQRAGNAENVSIWWRHHE